MTGYEKCLHADDVRTTPFTKLGKSFEVFTEGDFCLMLA